MKLPLFAMTILGLSLIAYGVFNLMQKNPEFRAEVMKLLPAEQQVQLTNLLNGNIDLGNRAGKIEAVDPNATCTGPTPSPNCNPPGGQPAPGQAAPPPAPAGTPTPPPAPSPGTMPGSPTEALMQLKDIKKNQEEAKKALDQLMEEK